MELRYSQMPMVFSSARTGLLQAVSTSPQTGAATDLASAADIGGAAYKFCRKYSTLGKYLAMLPIFNVLISPIFCQVMFLTLMERATADRPGWKQALNV
jgi:hypothetical protein